MVSRERRNLKSWLAGAMVWLLTAGAVIAVEPLELPILQFNQNRFYFGVGTEQLVFEHAPFKIINQSDTLYSGTIEYSGLGVCYSHSIENWTDTTSIHYLHALIEPAEIESPLEIRLVLDQVDYQLFCPSSPFSIRYQDVVICTEYGDSIETHTVCIDPEHSDQKKWLKDDRIVDSIDGVFHQKIDPTFRDGYSTDSLLAPYIAVLLPAPDQSINDNGILSTSLYFRFNQQLLNLIYTQGTAEPVNRLTINSSSTNRLFPLNMIQGERLLSHLSGGEHRIELFYEYPELESVCNYFADVLSRDRVEVAVEWEYHGSPTLVVTLIPFMVSDPLACVTNIYDRLNRYKDKTRFFKENLAQVGDKIRQYHNTDDSTIQRELLRQIDNIFQKDLGVFPLFRPKLYFTASKQLQRAEFDQDGYPIYEKMIKVKLPQPPDGTKR